MAARKTAKADANELKPILNVQDCVHVEEIVIGMSLLQVNLVSFVYSRFV